MHITDYHEKTGRRVTAWVTLRVNELHDFLSCHNRTNEDDVHMPVGDISRAEG